MALQKDTIKRINESISSNLILFDGFNFEKEKNPEYNAAIHVGSIILSLCKSGDLLYKKGNKLVINKNEILDESYTLIGVCCVDGDSKIGPKFVYIKSIGMYSILKKSTTDDLPITKDEMDGYINTNNILNNVPEQFIGEGLKICLNLSELFNIKLYIPSMFELSASNILVGPLHKCKSCVSSSISRFNGGLHYIWAAQPHKYKEPFFTGDPNAPFNIIPFIKVEPEDLVEHHKTTNESSLISFDGHMFNKSSMDDVKYNKMVLQQNILDTCEVGDYVLKTGPYKYVITKNKKLYKKYLIVAECCIPSSNPIGPCFIVNADPLMMSMYDTPFPNLDDIPNDYCSNGYILTIEQSKNLESYGTRQVRSYGTQFNMDLYIPSIDEYKESDKSLKFFKENSNYTLLTSSMHKLSKHPSIYVVKNNVLFYINYDEEHMCQLFLHIEPDNIDLDNMKLDESTHTNLINFDDNNNTFKKSNKINDPLITLYYDFNNCCVGDLLYYDETFGYNLRTGTIVGECCIPVGQLDKRARFIVSTYNDFQHDIINMYFDESYMIPNLMDMQYPTNPDEISIKQWNREEHWTLDSRGKTNTDKLLIAGSPMAIKCRLINKDWYIPASIELYTAIENFINKYGTFRSNTYWTSTQINNELAFTVSTWDAPEIEVDTTYKDNNCSIIPFIFVPANYTGLSK